jgi:transposase
VDEEASMLLPSQGVRVYVCVEPVDMRRSFYGLYGVAKDVLEEDPQSGAFLNKQADYLKALYWSGDGFCLWAKRLERGTFERLRTHDGARKRSLSFSEFQLLVEGIDLSSVRRRKRLPGSNRSCA